MRLTPFYLLFSFRPDADIYKNKKRSRTAALQEHNADITKSPSKVKGVKRRTVASLFSNYTGEEDDDDDDDEEEEETSGQYQAPKRLALQDTNISRYRREFVEIELIGELIDTPVVTPGPIPKKVDVFYN